MNHNCKLYKVIRNAGGWDNWQMEIIAFHNCKDSHEAHKKEQEYFETLGATLNSIEPLPKPKEKIIKIVKEKTIMYCEPCNIHFSCRKAQETHNNTNKHHKNVSVNNGIQPQTTSENKQNPEQQFYCECCDYNTCNKFDFNKHNNTVKHKSRKCYIAPSDRLLDKSHYECQCGISYKHASSYYRHRRTCASVGADQLPHDDPRAVAQSTGNTSSANVVDDPLNELEPSALPSLVRTLLKENHEFKQLILDQSKQMLEICKEGRVIHHTTNHHNNQKFNLNFFLNTTCKDAINLSDFIETIEVQMNELENIGHNGYVAGMTDIILSRIKDLDVSKRPVHCTDLKRETMYIKDHNEWNKDTAEKSYLRKAISVVSKKNCGKTMEWRERNPECLEIGSPKYDFCFKMMRNVLGDFEDVQIKMDNKIIKSLAKEVVVDR
jgi:hypothetical protein